MSVQGYEAELALIRDRFEAKWMDPLDAGTPLTPVQWENDPFDPPRKPPARWVRVTVHGSNARRGSLGGTEGRYRHDGEVVVEVFAPLNEGDAGARALADTAAAVFRSWEHDGVSFWTPRLVRIGREGSWHRMNLIAPFKRDSVFTIQ